MAIELNVDQDLLLLVKKHIPGMQADVIVSAFKQNEELKCEVSIKDKQIESLESTAEDQIKRIDMRDVKISQFEQDLRKHEGLKIREDKVLRREDKMELNEYKILAASDKVDFVKGVLDTVFRNSVIKRTVFDSETTEVPIEYDTNGMIRTNGGHKNTTREFREDETTE